MKRIITILIAAATVFMLAGQAIAAPEDPNPCGRYADGSAEHPYVICVEGDLALLAAHPDAHFVLEQDVNITLYHPIIPSFSGELDGNFHQIMNAGQLFETIESEGIVRNLRIADVSVSGGGRYTPGAGLAAYNYGLIETTYLSGHISGGGGAGGLVYHNYGLIESSGFEGSVGGMSSAGGIADTNYGTIRDAFTDATVNGAYSVGGITGTNSGMIESCMALGDVTIHGSRGGGLVGVNTVWGTIDLSFAFGDIYIYSYTTEYGVLTGKNESGAVNNSYGFGSIITL